MCLTRLHSCLLLAGVFHVSAAQASACMERFGDLGTVSAPSPAAVSAAAPLKPRLQDVLAAEASAWWQQHTAGASSQEVEEAFCLATPPDNPTETVNNPLRSAGQPAGAARPGASTAATYRTTTSGGGSTAGEGASGLSRLGGGAALRAQARASPGLVELEELFEELVSLEGAAVAYQCTYAHAAESLHRNEVLQASAAVRRQRRRALLRLLREGRTMTSNIFASLSSWDDEADRAAAVDSSTGRQLPELE
jgi:hypothetical protein